MAITIKYLTETLGLDKETADKIFAERGKEIETDKSKYLEIETKYNDVKSNLDNVNAEFEKLKNENATAEDFKTQFEQLQADIKAKDEQAEADRVAKEKTESIANRFNSVVGDKKFSHEAIKNDYLSKFGKALENKDFIGKADADILHELVKDDANAFVGVQSFKLEGGKDFGNDKTEPTSLVEALKQKYE